MINILGIVLFVLAILGAAFLLVYAYDFILGRFFGIWDSLDDVTFDKDEIA